MAGACLLQVSCYYHLPIWMLWVVMQQEAMPGMSRVYMDGIGIGVVTTGLRPIIRRELPALILNWDLR